VRERSRRQDTELLLAAIAYVDVLHKDKDVAAENTAPPPGVTGRVELALAKRIALTPNASPSFLFFSISQKLAALGLWDERFGVVWEMRDLCGQDTARRQA
jgi:hypothetical protein